MTGDKPPPLSRFELAARELRALGIVMTRLPGEYRVNYRTGTDATARLVKTLDQALELAALWRPTLRHHQVRRTGNEADDRAA
jgi:hypothetical protein